MNTYQPCTGYDAAVSYLCIQIENQSHITHKSFDDVVSWTLFHKDDPLFEKIKHINEKYNRSIDEIIDRIEEYHRDW